MIHELWFWSQVSHVFHMALTLLHSEWAKLHLSFGLSEFNSVVGLHSAYDTCCWWNERSGHKQLLPVPLILLVVQNILSHIVSNFRQDISETLKNSIIAYWMHCKYWGINVHYLLKLPHIISCVILDIYKIHVIFHSCFEHHIIFLYRYTLSTYS